jgi:hypothetical protein
MSVMTDKTRELLSEELSGAAGDKVSVHNPFRMQVVELTPELAGSLLNKVPEYQRRMRVRIVERYARDMTAGNWKLTHQPIAIDEDGALADGRHRVAAVQLSGVSIKTYVAVGVPKTIYPYIDAGTQRRIYEVSGIAAHEAALMRAVHRLAPGLASRVLSVSELMAFWAANRDSLDYVCYQSRRRVGGYTRTTADINAALWRAYKHMEFAQFERLAQLLWSTTPVDSVKPGDGSVRLLREYVLAGIDAKRGRPVETGPGREPQRVRYAKTERAVLAYMEGHDMDKLTAGDSSELFPLPDLDVYDGR